MECTFRCAPSKSPVATTRCSLGLRVISTLFCMGVVVTAEQPRLVPLVELVANPERYDKATVCVRGYLTIYKDMAGAVLSLSREDADNQLGNGTGVVLNEKLLADAEKLSGRYVSVVGVFRTIRVAGAEGLGTEIRDVKECIPWPNRQVKPKLTSR